MKAAYIEAFSPSGNIKVGNMPRPEPQEGEVEIAVSYAGVNPADAKIAAGLFQSRMPHRFPLILGWEASGIVERVGKNVSSFHKGEKVYVYGRKPILEQGSWAEYFTFPEEHGAKAPKNLSLAEAAGVPLAGLTAWQSLFDKVQLKRGEKVLIHAGGGGVGSFAIQWAKLHGAFVITTASPSKFEYVKKLGADEIIDYTKGPFAEQLKRSHPEGVEVVFDTLGKSVYKESFPVLKRGGRIVSLLEQPDAALRDQFGVRAEYHFVIPNGKQLQAITELFDQGKAEAPAVRTIPLDQVSLAVDEIRKGTTKGKLVLDVCGKLCS